MRESRESTNNQTIISNLNLLDSQNNFSNERDYQKMGNDISIND